MAVPGLGGNGILSLPLEDQTDRPHLSRFSVFVKIKQEIDQKKIYRAAQSIGDSLSANERSKGLPGGVAPPNGEGLGDNDHVQNRAFLVHFSQD